MPKSRGAGAAGAETGSRPSVREMRGRDGGSALASGNFKKAGGADYIRIDLGNQPVTGILARRCWRVNMLFENVDRATARSGTMVLLLN
jgi:hypothetical protein